MTMLFFKYISVLKQALDIAGLPSENLSVAIIYGKNYEHTYKELTGSCGWGHKIVNRMSDILREKAVLPADTIRQLAPGLKDTDIVVCDIESIPDGLPKLFMHMEVAQGNAILLATALLNSFAEVACKCTPPSLISADIIGRIAVAGLLSKISGWAYPVCQDLLGSLERIAITHYESKGARGTMVFEQASCTACHLSVTIANVIPFTNTRGVRKMLETCKDIFCITANGQGVRGLIKKEHVVCDCMRVDFLPDHSWVLSKGSERVMQVRAGVPGVYRERCSEAEFTKAASSRFPYLDEGELRRLFSLVNHIAQQSQGANILIGEAAQSIAQRLRSQCTVIEPVQLDEALLLHIAGIDGTVIMDPLGVCTGFGAILDGLATTHGDTARGGRYNSAVMYCHHSTSPCIIIVISQDGYVDIITSEH